LRLDGEARGQRLTRRGNTPALLFGVLRCAACGDRMTPQSGYKETHGSPMYVCYAPLFF
jgi:hypothetical protein